MKNCRQEYSVCDWGDYGTITDLDIAVDKGPGKTTILGTAAREDPVMETLDETGVKDLHNSLEEDTNYDGVVVDETVFAMVVTIDKVTGGNVMEDTDPGETTGPREKTVIKPLLDNIQLWKSLMKLW